MSRKTQFFEVAVQAATMVACAGAVVAAGFTTDKIVELKNNSSLVEEIKGIDQNIQIRLDATVAVALASGLVIPLGLIMIIISLCNINFGTCAKVMAVMDITAVLLAACGFAAAGALGALTAKDWTDTILSVSGDLVHDIRVDIAATSGCSLLACLCCVLLLLFIVVQWLRRSRQEHHERSTIKYSDYMGLK